MASTIVTKNSSTASAVPVTGDLTQGELAVNVTDKKLYTKDSGGTVVKLVGGLGNQEANAVAITGGSINGTTIGATTASTGAFTTLSASSTVSGTGFSTYLASPPAIGGTTAAAGSFTTLSASGNTTLSGGTANGVAYLNGSKVVTTGSALTFDGTNLGLSSSAVATAIKIDGSGRYKQFETYQSGSREFYFGYDSTSLIGLIYQDNNRPIAFGISGSEQMRLTSTGLGIGTSSSVVFVDNGGTQANPRLLSAIPSTNTTRTSQAPALTLLNSSSTLTVGRMARLSFAAVSSGIGSPIHSADITAVFTSGATGNGVSSNLIFSTTNNTVTQEPQERMRLDSSGNLGLGVTPSAWSGLTSFSIASTGSNISSASNDNLFITSGAYYNGTNWIYKATSQAVSQYNQLGGAHKWYYAASGTAGNTITFTQAMTLDASGRLLIGNTTNSNGEALQIDANGVGSTLYTALFRNTSTSTSVYNAVRFLQGASGSAIGYIGTGGSAVANAAFANNFVVGTQSSSALVFNTNDTERARIDSSGNLLVGTTSSGDRKLYVKGTPATGTYLSSMENTTGTAANAYGLQIYYSGSTPNGAGNQFIDCVDATTVRFRAYSNGGLANYSANNVNLSDRREKTNFAPADEYLSKICAIPVQTYNYIDQDLENDPGLTLGVVAQDVQTVAPELVMESNWAKEGEEPKMRLSIYQTDLQYALMKCIQEQQALITQLTARITALEAK